MTALRKAFHHVTDAILESAMVLDLVLKFLQLLLVGQSAPYQQICCFLKKLLFLSDFLNPNAAIL